MATKKSATKKGAAKGKGDVSSNPPVSKPQKVKSTDNHSNLMAGKQPNQN